MPEKVWLKPIRTWQFTELRAREPSMLGTQAKTWQLSRPEDQKQEHNSKYNPVSALMLSGREGLGTSYYQGAECLEGEVQDAKGNMVSLTWS